MSYLNRFVLALALGAALVLAVQWVHQVYDLRKLALSETATVSTCDQAELTQE